MNLTGEGIQGIPQDINIRSIRLTNDGVERLINGTFTGNATGWTLASGWAYSSNTVIKNGAGTGVLEQSVGAQVNDIYLLTFTISNWTAGTTLTPSIGGTNGTAVTGNISFSEYIKCADATNLKFTPTTNVRCTIDGVSVKRADCIECVNSSGTVIAYIRSDGTISTALAAITGGTITGITDLAVADGGTGASTVAGWDMSVPPAIGGTTPGTIWGKNKEIYKTASADSPLTAAECSGTVVSNYGMTDADCTIDLPTAEEGLSFVCILPTVRARFFKLHCPTDQADKIYLLGVAGSDDGNVGVASGYATGASASFFTFKASDGGFDWMAIPIFGTWAAS